MTEKLTDTLLLVGSADSDRALLRGIFESSYNLLEAENVSQALLLLTQNRQCVAAVVLDVPPEDDAGVRELAQACHPGDPGGTPLIMIVPPSATGLQEAHAFDLGASDVLVKPYSPAIIRHRLHVLADYFFHRRNLEELVNDQSETIRNTNQVMLDALSAIIEYRSTESGNHVLRIRRFTKILLEDVLAAYPDCGLTADSIDIIASASALHDIGKIAIPDDILNKPSRLTEEEFEIMKTHTTVGGRLVETLSRIGDAEYLRYAYNIALYHHERWDGSGYPLGLAGDEIPLCAQAVGIADCFDALTTKRVYKDALPFDQAINMILNGECGIFSPRLLECFKHVRAALVELAGRYADGYSPKSDVITMPLPGPVWHKPQLDTLQLSQVKYQALMHHMNDTVIELDFDIGLYHIVYNPDPNFDRVASDGSFISTLKAFAGTGVHPDDQSTVQDIHHFFDGEFFAQSLRRKSFRLRIYDTATDGWCPYEVTLLRVNVENDNQHIALGIWHKLTPEELVPMKPEATEYASHAPALEGLLSSVLCCQVDRQLSIVFGAGSLYSLTGYTREDIRDEFSNSLAALICPGSAQELETTAKALFAQGGNGECEFLLRTKTGESISVLDKCRLYRTPQGEEYFYHCLTDNTRFRQTKALLEKELERSSFIIAQSESIVFELDLAKDQFLCSRKWKDHFGYAPLSENFLSRVSTESHIHPDDLAALLKTFRALVKGRSGETTVPLEVRIANSDGRYLWCRARATLQTDSTGKPTGVIGTITDIDALKRATIALKEKAERDALTKLLNKLSVKQFSTEYLSERSADEMAALLILDLDNFKNVNDLYGHLFGDSMLAYIGKELKQLFRSHDIIGRIGGDEFLILMKNIPSESLLRDRCALLLDTFNSALRAMAPEVNVSFSIGAAICPNHGSSYAELFQRADEALYQAKAKGKSTFCVYDGRANYARAGGERAITRIDSNDQPALTDDQFLRYIFRNLYESTDPETTVNELLAHIGEQLNVSRVYIFENSDDNLTCSNTFEWCNVGISPEKDLLQNVSYVTDIAGWPEVYNERGIFYCTDISSLEPRFRAILEPQGIKSMLQCAIMDNGVFRGYVGFDECTSNRMWTQDQISMLEHISRMFSVFLLKKRTQDKLAERSSNLQSILDNQDAWIYVINPDTFELRFLNAKAKESATEGTPGRHCYEVFMGLSSPCEGCHAKCIREKKNSQRDVENTVLGMKVRSRASLITWNGEDACLITCHRLD